MSGCLSGISKSKMSVLCISATVAAAARDEAGNSSLWLFCTGLCLVIVFFFVRFRSFFLLQ